MSIARGHVIFLGIQMQFVPVKDVRVDHRRQQIVRRSDGMKIAVEMQIDFFGRLDSRAPAARPSALLPEHGAQRRFPRSDDRALAQFLQPLRKADRGHRLAFAGLGGTGGRYQNQLAPFLERWVCQQAQLQFDAVGTASLDVFFGNVQLA